MGLHVRTITPYALPGVLALLACWWFFSRKKDRRSTKHDHISARVNEVETVDALENIFLEEVHSNSRAQLVQLDKEEEIELQEDCTCSLPLGEQESSLYSIQSNCRVQGDLVKQSHLNEVDLLQGFADQEVDEIKSSDDFRENELAEVHKVVQVSPSSVLSQSLDGNKVVKRNPDTSLNDVEKLCTISTEPLCGCSEVGDMQKVSHKVIDPKISFIHDSELLEVCSQTEALDDMPEKNVPVNEIKAEDTRSPLPQAETIKRRLLNIQAEDAMSPLPQAETIERGLLNIQAEDAMSPLPQAESVERGLLNIQAEDAMSPLPQAETIERGLPNRPAEDTMSPLPQAETIERGLLHIQAEDAMSPLPQAETIERGLLNRPAEDTMSPLPQADTIERGLLNRPLEDTMSPLPQAESVERGLLSRQVERNSSGIIVSTCHDQNQTQKVPYDPLIQQKDEVHGLRSAKQCFHSEGVEITQSDETSAVFVKELDVQPSVAGMLVDNAGSHVLQCCQSIDDIGLVFIDDDKLFEASSSESILSEQVTHSPLDLTTQSHLKAVDYILQDVDFVTSGKSSDSCVKSSITEVVSESNCTNLLNTFSKCLEKSDESENLCPVVDLKEENPKIFLADYEANIVEQLAINIISKVIVAARQEILSSSVSDASDSSCQILDENRDGLTRDEQSKQLVPESDEDSVSADFALGVIDFDCTCESTQFEPLQKNFRNTELTGDEFCLEHQREEKHNAPNTTIHQMPSGSDFSPVHRRTDFFEESQPALEDSSLSVCTSEECINMDDPLQSTVLSISIGGYDSLNSSGIGLSRETFNVSIEEPMKATCGENDKELYSNGDIKRGSPDLNNEGPLTTESEVDHSGGEICSSPVANFINLWKGVLNV